MKRWLISIGTVGGDSREITVEADSEDDAFDLGEGLLETGETLQGLIPDPEQGPNDDEWAGSI